MKLVSIQFLKQLSFILWSIATEMQPSFPLFLLVQLGWRALNIEKQQVGKMECWLSSIPRKCLLSSSQVLGLSHTKEINISQGWQGRVEAWGCTQPHHLTGLVKSINFERWVFRGMWWVSHQECAQRTSNLTKTGQSWAKWRLITYRLSITTCDESCGNQLVWLSNLCHLKKLDLAGGQSTIHDERDVCETQTMRQSFPKRPALPHL